MDIKQFLEGIKFDYLQPYEPIPENWNITKSLNNTIYPENDTKLRNLLRDNIFCKYLNQDYSFTIAGILNKALSLMRDDGLITSDFVFLGNNLAYFHAAIIGNGDKSCTIANSVISKSTARRLLHPHFKSHHLISNNDPAYFIQTHKKHNINRIGLLFLQGDNCKLLKLVEKKGLFDRGSVIICTGMNHQDLYDKAMDFVAKPRSIVYRPEILLFQQTNKDGNHPTYWDGIFCMRFI